MYHVLPLTQYLNTYSLHFFSILFFHTTYAVYVIVNVWSQSWIHILIFMWENVIFVFLYDDIIEKMMTTETKMGDGWPLDQFFKKNWFYNEKCQPFHIFSADRQHCSSYGFPSVIDASQTSWQDWIQQLWITWWDFLHLYGEKPTSGMMTIYPLSVLAHSEWSLSLSLSFCVAATLRRTCQPSTSSLPWPHFLRGLH